MSSVGAASERAAPSVLEIANSREWLVRLHYRQSILGKNASEVDGPNFFLAAKGKTDPHAELLATLEHLSESKMITVGAITEPAACWYPERKEFLESRGFQFPNPECPRFKSWFSRMSGTEVSLLFAAPYFGSPSSLFGHTFLKVSKGGTASPLLDPAVSFEAYTGEDAGAGYVAKGLLGFYPGLFGTLPFHLKLNVYQSVEARDLWEYRLNFSATEVESLLKHLWEMGSTFIDYYFFNENCSYHLLSLLEVIKPEREYRSHFRAKAIPADTARVAVDPGERLIWPSALAVLRRRLSQLSVVEQKAFFFWKENQSRIPENASQDLLDAMIDWARMEHGRKSNKVFDPQFQVPLPLLVARSKLAKPSAADPLALSMRVPSSQWDSKLTPPTDSHGTMKYTLGLGKDVWKRSAGELRARLAVHDELDPSAGYLPLTRLTIGDFVVRGTADELAFDEITLAEVRTLEPGDRLQPEWAWSMGAGFKRNEELDCRSCLTGQVRAGFGKSLSLLGDFSVRDTAGTQLVVYLLARGQGEVGNVGSSGQRLGAGGEGGFILDSRSVSALINFEHLVWLNTVSSDSPWTERATLDIRWHGKGPHFQLGFRYQWLEMARPLVQTKIRDQFLIQLSYFPQI